MEPVSHYTVIVQHEDFYLNNLGFPLKTPFNCRTQELNMDFGFPLSSALVSASVTGIIYNSFGDCAGFFSQVI